MSQINSVKTLNKKIAELAGVNPVNWRQWVPGSMLKLIEKHLEEHPEKAFHSITWSFQNNRYEVQFMNKETIHLV